MDEAVPVLRFVTDVSCGLTTLLLFANSITSASILLIWCFLDGAWSLMVIVLALIWFYSGWCNGAVILGRRW